jgi:hypothetical protein
MSLHDTPQATAKRDGVWASLDAALLVPGDLVLVASGASVPADVRISHGTVRPLGAGSGAQPPGAACAQQSRAVAAGAAVAAALSMLRRGLKPEA